MPRAPIPAPGGDSSSPGSEDLATQERPQPIDESLFGFEEVEQTGGVGGLDEAPLPRREPVQRPVQPRQRLE